MYNLASHIGEQLLEERMKLNEEQCIDTESVVSQTRCKDSCTETTKRKSSSDQSALICAKTPQKGCAQMRESSLSLISEPDSSGFGECMTEAMESCHSVFKSIEMAGSVTCSAGHSSSPECSSPVSISVTLPVVASEPLSEINVEQQVAPPSTPKAGSDFGDEASSEAAQK